MPEVGGLALHCTPQLPIQVLLISRRREDFVHNGHSLGRVIRKHPPRAREVVLWLVFATQPTGSVLTDGG